jgi:hypothetical protein
MPLLQEAGPQTFRSVVMAVHSKYFDVLVTQYGLVRTVFCNVSYIVMCLVSDCSDFAHAFWVLIIVVIVHVSSCFMQQLNLRSFELVSGEGGESELKLVWNDTSPEDDKTPREQVRNATLMHNLCALVTPFM